jgi:hypothetical protein
VRLEEFAGNGFEMYLPLLMQALAGQLVAQCLPRSKSMP